MLARFKIRVLVLGTAALMVTPVIASLPRAALDPTDPPACAAAFDYYDGSSPRPTGPQYRYDCRLRPFIDGSFNCCPRVDQLTGDPVSPAVARNVFPHPNRPAPAPHIFYQANDYGPAD